MQVPQVLPKGTDGIHWITVCLVAPQVGDDPYRWRRAELKSENIVELVEPILEAQQTVRKQQADEQFRVSLKKPFKEYEAKECIVSSVGYCAHCNCNCVSSTGIPSLVKSHMFLVALVVSVGVVFVYDF